MATKTWIAFFSQTGGEIADMNHLIDGRIGLLLTKDLKILGILILG